MTAENYLAEGYPETPHPAWGHPLYNLAAHLFNAISASARADTWFPMGVRQEAARKTTTVAVHYLHRALRQAVDAVVDLPAPTAASSDYQDGYNAAQNDVIEAIDVLRQRLIGGITPDTKMAIPDVPDQAS